MSGRRDFLSMPAPENYVAGLGRGATGFTTRSDLGPAREGPSEEQMKELLAKRAAQLGQAAPSGYGVKDNDEHDDDDERFADPDNETGLFSTGIAHNAEDDEADRIYQEVEERLDRKRRAKREAREKQEREEYEKKNPKIQQEFADLKRALGAVSEDEWASLPDVGDMTGRQKRAREARDAERRFYAVPDSVITGAARVGEMDTSISAESKDGTMTNFASIGAAQKSRLQVRLDHAASTATSIQGVQTGAGTSTSVDPKGYLTALDTSQALGQEAPVEDINRARLLLESAVRTNPTNGPGHVALARLEELAGKMATAKKVIARGCELCPRSTACWEENIRLNEKDSVANAKIIAAQAVKLNPKSITLWKAAIELEQTPEARRKVARQALDQNPSSVDLWKILINNTDDVKDVRLLFAMAIKCCPLSEELWIQYAKVSEVDQAQVILNQARKKMPTSAAVWIQACRLQEQLGKVDQLDMIMRRAVVSLKKEKGMLKRDEWIHRAEKCEEEGAVGTCGAIIRASVGWTLDENDERKQQWLQDAVDSQVRGKFETARAILNHCASVFPTSKKVWYALAALEKKHGKIDLLLDVFRRAVEACPQEEELWIAYANEAWHAGDRERTRKILQDGFDKLTNTENVYARAVQLEVDAGNFDTAREFLANARNNEPTDRIFYKSAALERVMGNLDGALDLIAQGLSMWPGCWKLYAIKGQIYESMGKLKEAQEVYAHGTRMSPKGVPLYILLSRLQERMGATVKARSSLDRGRMQNPKNAPLWCESVRLERRAGNAKAAERVMAMALQECPNSGLLWNDRIMEMEARPQRKSRALEAIKKAENDPLLYVTIARIFWSERRLEKAMTWFEKSLVTDPDFGDGWAWYWKFLEQHGTEEKRNDVLAKLPLADPRHGEAWQPILKDPKNVGKSPEEILKLVAATLEHKVTK